MDFKIEDEFEETTEDGESVSKKSSNNILPIIIIAVVAIICGLVVFLVSNTLFGKKEIKPDPIKSVELNLQEENVQILYEYVTYGAGEERNEKFIKEKNVNISSFTNQEKFYFALQFAQVEDFEKTDRIDESKHKIYFIPSNIVQEYMERFFGPSITYTTNNVITYPFSFSINDQNVGTLTYNEEEDGFDTVFDGEEEDMGDDDYVQPYYTELVKATKEPDGSYVLTENIIYTSIEDNGDDTSTINIYKDYAHTELIETKPNQTEELLESHPIDIKDYSEKCSTITYTFKLNGNMLYFDNSVING